MPLSVIVDGEFVALLVTATLPLTLPTAAGANPTVRARLCPAASVTPPENPLTVNAALETLTWEMVTLPVPSLVKLTD